MRAGLAQIKKGTVTEGHCHFLINTLINHNKLFKTLAIQKTHIIKNLII
jgi:hypothetical protein